MSLAVNSLKKSFHQGGQTISVLKDVTFSANAGEVVAILGKSGSGKSTLMGLLGGLDQPDSGSIQIQSKELTTMSSDERVIFRGTSIGIVFQSYHLVPHLTALENIQLQLEILDRPSDEKAHWWLSQVGLSDRAGHFPSQLSGGESQRVALARALVHEPSLILADEPSGHLDQETGGSVMDLFFKIVRSTRAACLLVTHDEALAARCDRRLHLQSGYLA